MRIGIYLGRHSYPGGGAGVFVRSLSVQTIAAINRDDSAEFELVIYGDTAILDAPFLERISLLPQLTEVNHFIFGRGARGYFRTLPNGARVRVVVQLLPRFFGRRSAIIFDQLLVPFLCRRDRLDLLHAAADLGPVLRVLGAGISSKKPAAKLVTLLCLPELSQNSSDRSPAAGARQSDRGVKNRTGSAEPGLWPRIYAWLFQKQFGEHGEYFAAPINRRLQLQAVQRYGIAGERASTITIGPDEYIGFFLKTHLSAGSKEKLWADREFATELGRIFKLEPGYALLYGSAEERNNFEPAFRAWLDFAAEDLKSRLVILAQDDETVEAVGRISDQLEISQSIRSRIAALAWVDREDLPFVLAGARLLIHPAISSKTGLGAVEAFVMNTPVVSTAAEADQSWFERYQRLHFSCDPLDPASIVEALKAAAARPADGGKPDATIRMMEHVVRDYISLYRKIWLQHTAPRGR